MFDRHTAFPALTALPRRRGQILTRTLIFLTGFAVVLLGVTYLYLLPALRAAENADPAQRRQLAASATLMLAVVLFVLFAGLVLTFRIGRFFFPRGPARRNKPTEYVDAWAEAGRRAATPEREEREE